MQAFLNFNYLNMKITKNNIEDIFKSAQKSETVLKSQGYELIEDIMADSSGWGSEDEPAYTPTQLKSKILKILEDNPTVYTFITGVGQFQVYISVYKKTGKKTSKKIGNNTYLLGGNKIILHDTVILEQNGDNIILNTGGWSTRTTHDRMNQYLPANIWVHRVKYESKLRINGKDVDLIDGMTVKGYLNI